MNARRVPDRSIRSDSRPLYLQVVRAIIEYAEDEGLRPGSPLPSEPDLATMFAVGRTTIREALVYLENERLIERSRGHARPSPSSSTNPCSGSRCSSPRAPGRPAGMEMRDRDIRIETSNATRGGGETAPGSLGFPRHPDLPIKTLVGAAALMDSVVPGERPCRPTTSARVQGLDHQAHPGPNRSDMRRLEVTRWAVHAGAGVGLALRRCDPVIVLEELFFADDDLPLA